VQDNRAELKPTLDKLNEVLTLLEDNKADIEKGLELMAPFTRVFANTLGTGRWFDTYVSNLLVPVGAPTLAGVTP
jgi:phospholipid/cholesterol/gamma-HCH transport system substrate-binding protein